MILAIILVFFFERIPGADQFIEVPVIDKVILIALMILTEGIQLIYTYKRYQKEKVEQEEGA